ncbi:MAG: isoprenylcysteine carboxylmethyltransferase family protein [Bacillota bacterium]
MAEIFAPTVHNLIFALVTLLWWAEFVIFPSRMDSRRKSNGSHTYRLILVAVSFTVGVSLILHFLGIGRISAAFVPAARTAGLTMYTSGLILRYWSSIILGREFTRGIEVSEEMRLVTSGPYRLLRHPLYLGLMLLTLGVPAFLGNILGFLIGSGVMFISLARRVEAEERQLLATLGDEYARWIRGRYRLLPFIY